MYIIKKIWTGAEGICLNYVFKIIAKMIRKAIPEDLIEINNLRKRVFSNDVLVPDLVYQLILLNQSENIFVLEERGIITGYFALIFIDERVKNQLINKEINESEFTINEIRKINYDSKYYIYILSIVSVSNNSLLNVSLIKRMKKIIDDTLIKINQFNPQIIAKFENIKLETLTLKAYPTILV